MKVTVKAALLREREQMRKRRYTEEFRTIYDDNLCPICHHRHMTGVVCRRHRGSVCEKHCLECEYHKSDFWRCSYKETKENLWRGIYRRELIRHDETISAGGLKTDDPAWMEAVTRATETVMERDEPKYIIADTQDENGDYALLDADTGEVMPFVVKHLAGADAWACVQYVDVGA